MEQSEREQPQVWFNALIVGLFDIAVQRVDQCGVYHLRRRDRVNAHVVQRGVHDPAKFRTNFRLEKNQT